MKTHALPLVVLEQALVLAKGDTNALVHHSDHGCQYTSITYNNKLAEYGIRPSSGTVGDSYDNALAESVNGLYKTELIYSQPRDSLAQVEIATMDWVHWWNNQRLHESLGYNTPTETITMYNQQRANTPAPV